MPPRGASDAAAAPAAASGAQEAGAALAGATASRANTASLVAADRQAAPGRDPSDTAAARTPSQAGPAGQAGQPAALGDAAVREGASRARSARADAGQAADDHAQIGTAGVPLQAAAAPAPEAPREAPAWLAAAPIAPAAGSAASPVREATIAATPSSAAFGEELGAQVALFVRNGTETARLHLHPAELGPVTVRIQLEGQQAQVHFAAEVPATRQALEQAWPALAGQLADSGITLAGGGVSEQPRQMPQPDGSPAARGTHGGDPNPQPAGAQAATEAPATPRRRGLIDLVA
jgi:flagellar hook-length control protein FliK